MAAPKGNTYAANGHRWRAAIEQALDKRSRKEQLDALVELADKLIDMAMEGDLGALKELGDRLDGKAIQALDVKSDGPLQITLVRFSDLPPEGAAPA